MPIAAAKSTLHYSCDGAGGAAHVPILFCRAARYDMAWRGVDQRGQAVRADVGGVARQRDHPPRRRGGGAVEGEMRGGGRGSNGRRLLLASVSVELHRSDCFRAHQRIKEDGDKRQIRTVQAAIFPLPLPPSDPSLPLSVSHALFSLFIPLSLFPVHPDLGMSPSLCYTCAPTLAASFSVLYGNIQRATPNA